MKKKTVYSIKKILFKKNNNKLLFYDKKEIVFNYRGKKKRYIIKI